MNEQKGIPTSKVARATKFVTTGAKIGGNYIKHYAKKVINPDLPKEELDKANAEDVYETLSTLKGSALKVAQMMSMDKHTLPESFAEKFAQAQYSAPALSYPLVVKTFKKSIGKSPTEVFDTFSQSAIKAASIGQVHAGTIGDKKYAVKVQYPGVADSIQSDLKMVKPIALRMLNAKEKDISVFINEVENMLLDETDYSLELKRSMDISEACSGLDGVVFPSYYPELSSNRVLTMEWLEGKHLDEFLKTNPSQEIKNLIGQRLWDFYDFQMHQLKKVHADPHPGNYLLREDGTLGVLDFGCVKEIPDDFYPLYFKILTSGFENDLETMDQFLKDLNIVLDSDTPNQQQFFKAQFKRAITLLMQPFRIAKEEKFDFGNESFFEELYAFGDEMKDAKQVRQANGARGNQHMIYLNRTYFGLYTILSDLRAVIKVTNSSPFQ